MGDIKSALRASVRSRRNSLSATESAHKSRVIQERVLNDGLYLESRAVALYSATGNEVATEAIRTDALASGKTVFYPRLSADKGLSWVCVRRSEDFTAGAYGIPEPTGDETLAYGGANGLIVFVPGVAFDVRGNRLGRGQGWYDRALGDLESQAQTVALAYEFQIVERVPTDTWDRRVQYIVTEERIIDCRESASPLRPSPQSLGMKRGY